MSDTHQTSVMLGAQPNLPFSPAAAHSPDPGQPKPHTRWQVVRSVNQTEAELAVRFTAAGWRGPGGGVVALTRWQPLALDIGATRRKTGCCRAAEPLRPGCGWVEGC